MYNQSNFLTSLCVGVGSGIAAAAFTSMVLSSKTFLDVAS